MTYILGVVIDRLALIVKVLILMIFIALKIKDKGDYRFVIFDTTLLEFNVVVVVVVIVSIPP